MERTIKIFDTTLRDGEQSPGCSMNLHEKIEMAKQLERLRVDTIEAGFPVSSPEDFTAVKTISETIKNCSVAGLARSIKSDIETAYNAVKASQNPIIHIFLATSDVHMRYKLKMTPDEVLQRTIESIAYAKTLCNNIEFSAEDASRSDREFLAKVFSAAINAGATTINIPDTVGYAVPSEMFDLVTYIKNNTANIDKAAISVHCHNDLGMATSNALAAVKAGATQIECTINGIGERAGNSSLEEVVMALRTRGDIYGCETNIATKQIYRTSKLLSTITGVPVAPTKPIVGANAFVHESGIHQHGVLCEKSTYEIMSPETVGVLQNSMILGKHSGRHAFEDRIEEMGYKISPKKLDKAFEKFKILADKKKMVTDKDIEALIGMGEVEIPQYVQLSSYVVSSGSNISASASVKIIKDDVEIEKVAMGEGAIDAAFKAIDKVANIRLELVSYSIQSVTEGEDALGEVIVKLERNGQPVTGRGISTDIIEASLKAYVNGINKAMML